MSDVPFHATRMGQRFFEATMPELVAELDAAKPDDSEPTPAPSKEPR